MERVLAWWRRAEGDAVDTTLCVVLVIAAIRVIVLYAGLDSLTTLEVGSSTLSRVLIALVSLVVAVFAARAWFVPLQPWSQRLAHWKRDRVGVWWLLGVAAVIAQTTFAAWLCEGFLGMGAQHLRGPMEVRRGIVVSLQNMYSARAVCKAYLKVRNDRDSEMSSICLVTAQRGSLSKVTPRIGESVDIHLRKTALGLVVMAVEPVSAWRAR